MDNIIGILGSSGTVGRHVAAYLLEKGYTVCGAQRRQTEEFADNENFTQQKVDIGSQAELTEFCKKCRYIINCIAPSFIYGEKVAKTAAENGCVYIDLTDAVMDKKLPEGGVYVTSCGYIPGLSAYLPMMVGRKYFDKVYSVTEIQGGNEICSANALIDIILSSEVSGKGDMFYSNGSTEHISLNIGKRYKLPFFDNEVFLKPYISHELVHLAEREEINCFRWFNVYENMEQFAFILKMVSLFAKTGSDELSDVIRKECDKRRKALNEEIHAILGAELIGSKDGIEKCVRYVLDVHDSSVLCGITAAVIAEQVIENGAPEGKSYGYLFIPEDFIEKISGYLSKGERFEITFHTTNEAFTAEL